MKRLIIMRHGEADNTPYDFKRQLTERGINQVIDKANALSANNIIPDLIYVSQAQRTLQTAQILLQRLCNTVAMVDKYELYLCSSRLIGEQLYEIPHTVDTLLIVGHNPGISDFYYEMTLKGNSFPTSGVAILDFDTNSWDDFQMVRPKLALELF